MKLQPFVYISEALVAQKDILGLISQYSKDLGCAYDRELLEKLWHEVTGTTRAQHRKYQLLSGDYKQKALRKYYLDVLDQLQPASQGASPATKMNSELADRILKSLSNPLAYSIVPETAAFINKLNHHGIKWGIIANEDHLYPLALKALGVKPHRLVNAHAHTFKPLPKMFQSAWSKVPAENQHDVWFIGDVNKGYDNVSSPLMRCILHTHGRTKDMSDPSHMRIRGLDDLDDMLGGEAAQFGELEVTLETHRLPSAAAHPSHPAVLLARGQKELGMVDIASNKYTK